MGCTKTIEEKEMSVFSTDSDILRYEPALFCDLHFDFQNISEGQDGVVDGCIFSSASGNFEANSVQAGGVICLKNLDESFEGVYEITSVDSAMELSVSVLRQSGDSDSIEVGQMDNLNYRITTFAPQCYEVMYQLTQYFGIRPGKPDAEYGIDDIYDKDVLRQASTYAVIASAYATLGSCNDDSDQYWKKSLYYQGLFEKARERCRLSIDRGDDGVSDKESIGGSIRLTRD